jgi:ATP-dependent protease ClpP protease subunit
MTARLAALVDRTRRLALALPQRADRAREATARPWYKINTDDTERAIVALDGEIGWDVDSSSFARDLRDVTAPAIDLQINSPGGSVWDGYAIYNALVSHPATITAHIVGVAASAASFIAMAADEIVAYRPSEMMIHDAAAYVDLWAVANPADLARVIDELTELRVSLDQTSDEIAGIYARKAGGTTEAWRAAMTATTWYTPDTAKAAGLVDRINGDDQGDAPADSPAPGSGATDRIERFRRQARATIVRAKAPAQLREEVK